MDKKKSKITLVIIALILIISLGYAALSTISKINSTIGVSKLDFSIIFDNVVESATNAIVIESAHISDDKNKEISFSVNFEELEKYYKFTTDIKNVGSIPGKIKSIELSGISDSLKKLIKYNMTYTATGKTVEIGDYIGPNSTKNITIDVRYQLGADVIDSDIPGESMTLSPIFTINYENGTMSEYREGAIANKLIKNKTIYNSTIVDFNRAANNNDVDGIYMLDNTKDDSFPIYFYRGGKDTINNHVLFANYCWRIIRTTENGGIKLIYNGVPNENNQCSNYLGSEAVVSEHIYTTGWNSYDWVTSSIKPYLDGWFVENLNDYRSYIDDIPFCHNADYTPGNVSLDCSAENQFSVLNGKSNNPIGLITAQEANLCGASVSGSGYPWTSVQKMYWTMSGNTLTTTYGGYTGYGAGTQPWYIGSDGTLTNSAGGNDRSYGVRPVISLTSDSTFVNGGEGTTTNPYVIETN